ncbi:hypothetical protein [Haloarchaeobius sp. TZWWS8]|uniref:hypothetical protein n=1 Tax=Haloarchaeobius sp. TZWWS8 TaxID=3446121 RepID=UPI003EB8FDDD
MGNETAATPVAFFRQYVKTWVHGLATAAMTAFGTLTVVHRWFAVVALASYVAPLVGYYLVTRGPDEQRGQTTDRSSSDEDRAAEPPTTIGEVGEPGWRTADLPTEADLADVAVAEGTAHAVGSGGVVLAGESTEDDARQLDWEVALADGPAARGNDLAGVDATADGDAVWVAGSSGALGRIDPESGRHVDFSAPLDLTDDWTDVSVARDAGTGGEDAGTGGEDAGTGGEDAGEETLVLATGSGELLFGRYRDGDCTWDGPMKPGSGSSIAAVSLLTPTAGFCCDTNDGVFELSGDPHASSLDAERVGVAADGTPAGLSAVDSRSCLVAATDGVAHRYETGRWTPERVTDEALLDVAWAGEAVALSSDDVYRRTGPGDWTADEVGVVRNLTGVAGDVGLVVAVGDEGTVVERHG